MIRKLLCFLSCFVIFTCLLCIPVSAAVTQNPAHGTITVDTVEAATGDTVIVPIRIANNPGIMAITVSVTYDTAALTYEKYIRGYLKDYTVADHPDKGLIRFVNCEQKDRDSNDIMVSFQFKVKDNATTGLHPITIDYKVGDFANWKIEKLTPVIVPGGVKVAYNGSNCPHKKYSDWQVVASPGCVTPGAKQRTCLICKHADIADIPSIGHTYEDKWTIDQPATKTEEGFMSRHCIRCDAFTDLLTFTLKQTEEEKIINKENTEIPKTGFVKELIKTQLPDEKKEELEQKESSSPVSGDGDASTSDIKNNDTVISTKPNAAEKSGIASSDEGLLSAVAAFLSLIPDVEKFLLSAAITFFVFLRIVLI